MKENVLIAKLTLGQKQRLENNQMISQLMVNIEELQQLASGLLGVMRKMPGYDKAIKEMADEHEAKEKELAEKESEVTQIDLEDQIKEMEAEAEEVKVLDLGKE